MGRDTLNELSCPKCGTEVVLYKGWATFTEDEIEILSGAKWHCSNCDFGGAISIKDDGTVLLSIKNSDEA